MIDKAIIEKPSTHYGDGKHATGHFVRQRVSGALNVIFTAFFVWFVIKLAGADRATMVETIRNPFVAIPLALLIVNVCVHMRIGMNEVIDDYLNEDKSYGLVRTANTAFAVLVAAVTVLAIAKILFWG